MSEDLNTGELREISLKELRLRPGIFLKIQRLREGAPVKEAQFIAAIEGKGVMLTPSGLDSLKTEIVIGEEYLIHGFTGQTDFSFTAPVLNVFQAPFAHALVAYPASVKAKKVRKSMRMKIDLLAAISPHGHQKPIEVHIIDLSVDGAMISAPHSLGAIGTLFDLVFPIQFEEINSKINILAKLCHNTISNDGACQVGLSFENLTREHKLLLNYFIGKITEASPTTIKP